nr:histidine kinase [uncultured Chitinophaga sp.]
MYKSRLYSTIARVAQHVLFWSVITVIFLYTFKQGPEPERSDYLYTVLFQLTLVPVVYINLYLLLPRLLKAGKWTRYVLFTALVVLAGSWLNFKFFQEWSAYVFPDYFFISYFTLWQVALFFCVYLLLSGLLHFSRSWFLVQEMQQRLLMAEKEQIQTELKALQSQINPHFFFNTLNGMYAMSLAEDKRLPDMILQLSQLMRYMIYEIREFKVPVEKEWEIVKHYIALQQLRTDHHLQINVETEGDFEEQSIPPMIIIPLVENAFKHGAKGNRGSVEINIRLTLGGDHINFYIENTMGKGEELLSGSGGLGLQNVDRRLSILYPGHYSLITQSENGKFIASITLPL